jgi:HlyD family secretion protein
LSAESGLEGHATQKFPPTLARGGPCVIPKRSLTGEGNEWLDTRVHQVICGIETEDQTRTVGQQVNVFIDAAASATTAPRAETSSHREWNP